MPLLNNVTACHCSNVGNKRRLKGKKGGARGGLECDIDILRGVKAKIIMKGKQGGAKGGFKYDVVILCNVVKESEQKVFRDTGWAVSLQGHEACHVD